MTIGQTIRQLRTARNWSQNDVAQAIDVTPGMVALMERGERKPSYETLLRLINVFEVSPNTLLAEAFTDGTQLSDVRPESGLEC